jgi:transposase
MRDNRLKIPGTPSNPDEGDLYEKIETRPGTTEKQKEAGRGAYTELLEAHARWAGGTLLGCDFPKDFREKGGTTFLNQPIKSGHDLAIMAQILRDPRYETLRIFYTRMNRIVHHTAVSSRLPGAVYLEKIGHAKHDLGVLVEKTRLLQEAIYNKRNLRLTVEGMLYRMRVGCPWRDLPEAFGSWNSIYKRFNAWSLSSKWLRIFKALSIDPDCEWEFIDGSYVKAHQHSAGAADKEPQAIGKSRAGNTTKIHLAVDSYGLPADFEITGGEVNDCSIAPDLIAKLPDAKAIVADKGYDNECIREQITKKGARAVIPRKRNSLKGNADMDWGLYGYRHLVENAFARLKQYRAVATRYDKLKRNFESMVAMACGYLWLPM